MAAPTFVGAGTGVIVQTGSSAVTRTATVGNFVILHILQDGVDTTPSLSSISGVEALDGTASSLTVLVNDGVPDTQTCKVGTSAPAARQLLFAGRATSTTVTTTVAVGLSGIDLYCRWYEFTNVNTGSTISDVLENVGAGLIRGGNSGGYLGTDASIEDCDVQTLGADRLALNFVAVDDDNAVAAFTGMTGGTWVEAVAEFASATGTDGCIQLQTAAMPSAGTINGGSLTMAAADNWGVIGFALIGTTVDAPSEQIPILVTARRV